MDRRGRFIVELSVLIVVLGGINTLIDHYWKLPFVFGIFMGFVGCSIWLYGFGRFKWLDDFWRF